MFFSFLCPSFQANFFDLSPANTVGKYTAKKGVDGVDGMIHKVFKLAKHYQPSVIFIGDGASIFFKKKPKVREMRAKRKGSWAV